ncbi:N-formylglutamate amidohydrolase [Gramella aestuarii]|uniref:N-formylglutamate amidohydrolase n=2 Tax=Christiangramia aestuarii TaxID=1028746 RepID=A0A7K1LPP2_9FLAO|nr:N-formylglutamate amidohydrolase [Christiangramia aestuarii]
MKLLLSCEHAFPSIPKEYQYLFESDQQILDTHEAFDLGAFDLYKFLDPIADSSHYQEVGRLLVESNRSPWHKKLFSRFSKDLPLDEKKKILSEFYEPYREKVQNSIRKMIEQGHDVLHFSVHSFTPVLHGLERKADIGILYDPGRKMEKTLALKIKEDLQQKLPGFRIRSNYPYLGKADGFTTSLRKIFPERYAGIELEVNQKCVEDNLMEEKIKKAVFYALQQIKKV